jgi:hypothetical protein
VFAFEPTYGSALQSSRTARHGRAHSRVGEGVLALALYVALAVALIGRAAAGHPAGGTLGTGPDVQIFEWGLRWWPYALGHGLDPLQSARVWPPDGGLVLWSTTVPLLSVLATPLTLLAGTQVSWNVLVVVAPATAAWAAWLLCSELEATPAAALFGGALFGFGSYELAQDIAHLQLTACVLVPLAVRVAVRGVRRGNSPTRLATASGAIVIAQFLVSPELLVTMLAMGVLALAGALWLIPSRRPETLATARAMTAGACAGAVVISPLLAVMLAHVPRHSSGAVAWPTDLLNLVVPTRRTAVGGAAAASISSRFPGNVAEQGAYLGVPVLLVVLAAARRAVRDPGARLALALLVVSLVLSLGSRLTIDGTSTIWMPWALASHVPLLDDALPARLSLFCSLWAAVIVAGWLSDPRVGSVTRAVAVLAIAVSLAPADWIFQAQPAAARSVTVDRALAHERVLSLPFFDVHERGLDVQQADDMDFSLIDAWLQVRPRRFAPSLPGTALTAAALSRLHAAGAARFVRELRAAGITRLLLWEPLPRLLAALKLPTVRAAGVVIVEVSPGRRRARGHSPTAP